jgi:hypothetical protein
LGCGQDGRVSKTLQAGFFLSHNGQICSGTNANQGQHNSAAEHHRDIAGRIFKEFPKHFSH